MPGQPITVQDPGDPDIVLRLIPEPGNLGTAWGAYLLLAACSACSEPNVVREVPILSVTDLADWPTSPAHPSTHRLARRPISTTYPSGSSTIQDVHRTVRSAEMPTRTPPPQRFTTPHAPALVERRGGSRPAA
jgi:hypothetical protein